MNGELRGIHINYLGDRGKSSAYLVSRISSLRGYRISVHL